MENHRTSYIPREGETIRYYSRRTNDGHGGYSEQHQEEMRAIAKEVVRSEVPLIATQIYNEALTHLIGALEYDIETVVEISFNDAHKMFHSEKLRKYVSDRIIREIKAKLGNQKIKL